MDSKNVCKQKFMVIFLYNLYIFVWLQHSCLANTILALDLNNTVNRIRNVHVFLNFYNEIFSSKGNLPLRELQIKLVYGIWQVFSLCHCS